jgi:hypothetical protein
VVSAVFHVHRTSLRDIPTSDRGAFRVQIIVPSSNDLEAFDQACVAAGTWQKLAGSDSAPPSC